MGAGSAVLPAPGTLVEVRCHRTCPWLGGFVVDALVPGDELYVRVKRPHHDRPLPTLLPVEDVRVA